MLQLAGIILDFATSYIQSFSNSLPLPGIKGNPGCTVTVLLLLLLLTVTPILSCPPSCECNNSSGLEVYCKDGRLLNIFTQIDSSAHSLTLDNVVDLRIIKKDRIRDLHAPEVAILKITASSVEEIEDKALIRLKQLEHLDLSENALSTLHANSFSGLSNLKVLNLSHNQLTTLEDSLLQLPNLIRLDVSVNYLKNLPPAMFSSQKLLTFLNLDGNPLKTLEGDAFRELSNLIELRARDCSLVNIEDSVFSALPELTTVNLGQNRLTIIPSSHILSRLIFLRTVYLDNNEFQSLPSSVFQDVNLQTLDLSYNRISKIDLLAFDKANLADLDISFNMIINLNRNILKPLAGHLTRLNLAGNPLRHFETDVLEDLQLLEMLNISSCSVDILEGGLLRGLPVLRKLDISHNSFHFLEKSVLDLFEKLDSISLHENTWVCDCNIKALRDWLTLAPSVTKVHCPPAHENHKDCTGLHCTLPTDLQGREIVQINDNELSQCHVEKSSFLPAGTQGAIVASCLGFAIIFLVITIFLWRRGRTFQGLKRVCMPSRAESSHVEDEDSKVPPLVNCDRHSLTLSDHNFVFRHYFDHLVTDPKLMADRGGEGENEDEENDDDPITHKERDSLYSSQPSLYSHHSDAGYGMESTV